MTPACRTAPMIGDGDNAWSSSSGQQHGTRPATMMCACPCRSALLWLASVLWMFCGLLLYVMHDVGCCRWGRKPGLHTGIDSVRVLLVYPQPRCCLRCQAIGGAVPIGYHRCRAWCHGGGDDVGTQVMRAWPDARHGGSTPRTSPPQRVRCFGRPGAWGCVGPPRGTVCARMGWCVRVACTIMRGAAAARCRPPVRLECNARLGCARGVPHAQQRRCA